jgi:tetratricopeptide (TPR) repeat protein
MVLLAVGVAAAQDDPSMQLLRQAVEFQKAGKLAEAIADYRTFLKDHPEAAPVRSNLGAALADEGHYADAVKEYNVALKSDPSNDGIRLNLGLAWYKMGNIAKAVSEFEVLYAASSADDPNHQRLALLLAECYLRQGKNDRVVLLLQPIEASQPNKASEYLLGTALLHEGQTMRGALLIQKLLKNGDTAEAHMLMAYTQYKAHDKGRALVEVNRAIALNPNLPEAYSLRGRLEFLEANPKSSEASFHKALALDQNNFDALLWLGTLLRQEGRLPEAGKDLTRALQLQPTEMRVRFQFARLCSDEGDNKRAAEVLQALIKDHPEYTEAHRTLATIYFRLGQPAEGHREKKIADAMDSAIRQRNEARGRSMTQ